MRTIVSVGAGPRNGLEQSFSPNVPREDIKAIPPEADLAAAVREQLQALGIYARSITQAEKAARERWEAIFMAIPARVRPTESDYEVADARVEARAVRDVLRFAQESGLIGEGQSQLEEVARALKTTYEEFTTTASTEGKEPDVLVAEYRAWLEANQGPDALIVLAYTKRLNTALKKIELLGLTRQELEGSKSQIYGSVLRDRLSVEPEFLRALVEGAQSTNLFEVNSAPVVPPKVTAVDPQSATVSQAIN